VVSGIVVTESGILAAAHLGAGSKRYFKNNGEKYIKDAYGLQYGVTWKHLEDMILHQ
jgi:hypothetical protein